MTVRLREDPRKTREAAERLGLAYEYRFTGYGDLASFMAERADNDAQVSADPTRR